jgi:hypothetical protein
MTKLVILFLVFLTAAVPAFSESKNGSHTNSFGIMFQVESLEKPLDNYSDGGFFDGRGGVGVRYWLLEQLVLRGVVYFDWITGRPGGAEARFGLSSGVEYHFVRGMVSPYAGGLAGFEFLSDSTQTGTDFHIGAMFGVEITALDFLAFFIEYSLLVTFREAGTEVDLGYNHLPAIGISVYFN